MSSAVPVVQESIIRAIQNKGIPCGDVSHSELVDKCSHSGRVLIFSPSKGSGCFVHADCESIDLRRRIGFSTSLVAELKIWMNWIKGDMGTSQRELHRRMEKLVAKAGSEKASRRPTSAPKSPPVVLTPSFGTLEKTSRKPPSVPRWTEFVSSGPFGTPLSDAQKMDGFLSGDQPTPLAVPHTTKRVVGYETVDDGEEDDDGAQKTKKEKRGMDDPFTLPKASKSAFALRLAEAGCRPAHPKNQESMNPTAGAMKETCAETTECTLSWMVPNGKAFSPKQEAEKEEVLVSANSPYENESDRTTRTQETKVAVAKIPSSSSTSNAEAKKPAPSTTKVEETGWEAVDFEETADSEYVFV